MTKPAFEGGRNIALKVPPHQYDATVRFYAEVLGLERIDRPEIGFVFGANQLWIDRAPGLSQSELWLEIVTEDTQAASRHFADSGIARCDEIEPLGRNFDGYWISSPCQIVHLVDGRAQSW